MWVRYSSSVSVAAALGEDRDEGGVVQVVGVDEGAVEVEEQRRCASCPRPARAAARQRRRRSRWSRRCRRAGRSARARSAKSGCAALWRGELGQELGRLERQHQLASGRRRGAAARAGDGPTPQAIANLIMVCSLAGPATPMWTGRVMPAAREPVGPGDDRRGLEGELGGDRHRARRSRAGRRPWRASAAMHVGVAAGGVDVAVALGVAGDVQVGEAVRRRRGRSRSSCIASA